MSTSSSSANTSRPVVLTRPREASHPVYQHHMGDLVLQDLGRPTTARQQDLWGDLEQPPAAPPLEGPTTRPRHSPWGACDQIEHLAPGMVRVHTAGHGGIHLDDWRIKALPPAFKKVAKQWYEEDCEFAIPMIAFNQAFPAEHVRCALSTLRNWNPDLYEAHFQVIIPAGMSYEKDKRIFEHEHMNSLLGSSAWSRMNARDTFGIEIQDHEILVLAYEGHCHPHLVRGATPRNGKFVCVSKDRYDARGRFHYVVRDDDRRITGAELTPRMDASLKDRR